MTILVIRLRPIALVLPAVKGVLDMIERAAAEAQIRRIVMVNVVTGQFMRIVGPRPTLMPTTLMTTKHHFVASEEPANYQRQRAPS